MLPDPPRRAQSLTRDHTVAHEQVRLGLISAREAAGAATHHVLSRSLGSDLFSNVDTSEHQYSRRRTAALLRRTARSVTGAGHGDHCWRGRRLDDAARQPDRLANERDGGDNISVQLIRVRSVERVGMYRGRPYKLLIDMTPIHPGDQLDHYRIEIAGRAQRHGVHLPRHRHAHRTHRSPLRFRIPKMEADPCSSTASSAKQESARSSTIRA